MSEWWSYRLSDFLLFAPRTYYRLLELYNASIWPAQIVAVGLGLAIWAALSRAATSGGRTVSATLAACWLWIAIAFHAHRYATINWAAIYFAWGFALEAVLLIWIGVVRGRLLFTRSADRAGRFGLGIFLFALAAQPMVGLAFGRSWRQVEIFGVAADPTAVATLGLLLLARGPGRWALFVVPTIWCAISGATLLAMKAPDFWVAPLAAVLVGAGEVLIRVSRSSLRFQGRRSVGETRR